MKYKHQLRLFFISILLIFSMTACHAVPDSMKPGAWVFDQMPKDAPIAFKQGWIDGCKTGLASMTNDYYKSFYQYTQDASMRSDPLYYKAWKDTVTFCRHYIYGTLRQGNVRMRLAAEPNIFLDNLFGGQHGNIEGGGIFTAGALHNHGPGTQGLLLENWGETAGQGFFESMGGELDYTGDMIWNGNSGGVMEWDFRPTHSIVPY